jgi:isoquinoline 1-oxidoreductase beta subunit
MVTGKSLYASDVRLPGMVYGRVLRAPAPPEIVSSLIAMDEAAARQVKGFVALVRSPLLQMASSEGVGIVAQTPGALDRIEQALQLRWSLHGQADVKSIQQSMDIDRRMAAKLRRDKYIHNDSVPEGQWDVELRIDVPIAAHAAIEPRVAVAQMLVDGRLEMWVGSQDVFYQRDVVCRRLGISADKVLVHGCRVGGAFGGKTISTVELESAVLAHQLKMPVKVQWTRAPLPATVYAPDSKMVACSIGATTSPAVTSFSRALWCPLGCKKSPT